MKRLASFRVTLGPGDRGLLAMGLPLEAIGGERSGLPWAADHREQRLLD